MIQKPLVYSLCYFMQEFDGFLIINSPNNYIKKMLNDSNNFGDEMFPLRLKLSVARSCRRIKEPTECQES